MRYLSVCSGIEAATVAWDSLGWRAAGFSEIEKFPSQVLAHHYPNVPKLGDMTKYKEWNIGTIDLLVGGTPCQAFSVAGLRKGMADPRGNLALVYCGILDHFRPRWFVWENVPGVLSSNGGRDFGSFLRAVAELGYGFSYRVLDAQWFGVAQRRRRVFVVGCLGDWRSAAAVLFERQSLRRDLAPSREAGQKVAETIAARFGSSRNNHEECVAQVAPTLTKECTGVSRTGNERVECDAIVSQPFDVANCLTARMHKGINSTIDEGQTPVVAPVSPYAIQGNLIGRGENAGPQGIGVSDSGAMYTLTKADVHGVAQPIPIQDQATRHAGKRGDKQDGKGNGLGVGEPGDPCYTLTKGDKHAVATEMAVRRLTPTEAERLQGFPDGYTDIQPNGKPTPDGPRYKALGNSMAVPVMAWIGKRIAEVDKL